MIDDNPYESSTVYWSQWYRNNSNSLRLKVAYPGILSSNTGLRQGGNVMSGWPVTPSATDNILNQQHQQLVADGSSGGGMVTENSIGGGGHQNIGGGGLNSMSSSSSFAPNNQQIPATTNIKPPLLHQEQAYHQLIQIMKAPNPHQQEDQILHILKTNPQLMDVFMKLADARQQQQQLVDNGQQQLQQDLQNLSLF